MVPELGKMIRRVTFLLLCLSAAAVELAADHTRPSWQALVWSLGWIFAAAGLGVWRFYSHLRVLTFEEESTVS